MTGDVYFHGTRIARADFDQSAKKLAGAFAARGLKADDVIALLMRNDSRFLVIAEACRLLGIRYVAINWHAVAAEITGLLTDSEAKLLIAHTDLLAPVLGDMPDDMTLLGVPTPEPIQTLYGEKDTPLSIDMLPDVIAGGAVWDSAPEKFRGMYVFTSGSTGKPKGIMRSVDADAPDRWATYKGLSQVMMQQQAGDRFYCCAPLYHSAPNALSVISLAAETVDVFLESKFDPEGFLRAVETHKITHAYIVPTMMIRLLKLAPEVRAKYDVSSLRYMVSTGSPCPIDVKAGMIDWFGPILFESYGASEIGFMTLISSQEALAKPGSVGRILDGGSVKVLGDDGEEVPTGEVGTLYIDLPIFGPYDYTNVSGDKDAHRHGRYSTVGDMGMVDEDGYIFISDRKKDMIISGGANIFPAEIEAQLIAMEQVSDCAVFGAPDKEFGEAIVAAVTLKPGSTLTLEDVRAFLEARLAKFKLPRKLDVHAELPRQDSGKIFKAKLREPYWDEAGRKV